MPKSRKGNRPEEIEVSVKGAGVAFEDESPPEDDGLPPLADDNVFGEEDGGEFSDEFAPDDEPGEFDARPAELPDFVDDDNVFGGEQLEGAPATPAQPTLVPLPPAVVFDELSIVVSGECDVQWSKGKTRGIADARVKVKREIHGSEVTAVDKYVPGAADIYARGTPSEDGGEPPMSGIQTQRNSKSEDVLQWTIAGTGDVAAMEIGEAVVDVASVGANSGKTTLTLAIKFCVGMNRLADLDALHGAAVVLRGRRLQGGMF